MKKTNQIPTKLKYELYEDSVQNHEADIEFIQKEFKRYYNRDALTFREDFGGRLPWPVTGLN